MVVEPLTSLMPGTQRDLGMLVEQSGWNQTAADWAVFADEGTIYVVRDERGKIVGSGAVLPFGPSSAWIGMILVAPEARGRGLGAALFQRCLNTARAGGRATLLDATPAGKRLYEQFGLEPLFSLTRWQLERHAPGHEAPAAKACSPSDIEAVVALDALAFGAPRGALLADILGRPGSRCLHAQGGIAMVRHGRIADHIGPLLAPDEAGAGSLLHAAVATVAGSVFIDVPDARASVASELAGLGFTRQRSFIRMAFGGGSLPGRTSLIHAIAGPEYG
jgi:GNAT superfamily N-acetyltransferase